MDKLKITVGILTWGSHQTLRNTLASYKSGGLLEFVDEVILFAQEISNEDLNIAEEYNIKIIGKPDNIGIGRAFTALMKSSSNEVVLILENDWVLVESPAKTFHLLEDGYDLITTKQIDFAKYRSRQRPGAPLYTRQYAGREMDSPPHLFDCVHYREHPDVLFPDKIGKIHGKNHDWYVCNSRWANHTNNPFMCSKEFYLKNITPFSGDGIDLEGKIFEWWQEQNFTVGHSDGLFMHERIDR